MLSVVPCRRHPWPTPSPPPARLPARSTCSSLRAQSSPPPTMTASTARATRHSARPCHAAPRPHVVLHCHLKGSPPLRSLLQSDASARCSVLLEGVAHAGRVLLKLHAGAQRGRGLVLQPCALVLLPQQLLPASQLDEEVRAWSRESRGWSGIGLGTRRGTGRRRGRP